MEKKFDVVVVGGGLSGYFCAMNAAKQGKNVAVVENRSYLGREITAKLRPWLKIKSNHGLDPEFRDIFLPEDEKCDIQLDLNGLPDTYREELILFCGTVKKRLLQTLLDQGVQVYLMSHVAGVITTQERICGLLIGNKYGFQTIETNLLIDTSETGSVCRSLSSEYAVIASSEIIASYTMEYLDVVLPADKEVWVDPSIGILGDIIILHPGKARTGQAYVEFSFSESEFPNNGQSKMRIENRAREFVVKVGGYLKQNHPSFQNAVLQNIAEEVSLIANCKIDFQINIQGLYNFQTPTTRDITCEDITSYKNGSMALIEYALKQPPALNTGIDDRSTIYIGGVKIPVSECVFTPMDDDRLNNIFKKLDIPLDQYVNISDRADILVAGGGTGGINAAITAASKGSHVIIIEGLAELGGTQTVGQVSTYYMGYQGEYNKSLDNEVYAISSFINGENEKQYWRVAKMLYYRQEFLRHHGSLLTGAYICGCRIKDSKITHVFSVDEYGVKVLQAEIFIDSTGDGDLAAFCGEDFDFGNGEMKSAQNYSQWDLEFNHVVIPLMKSHPDHDVINNTKYSELMRGLYLSHRKGRWYDFTNMLTVRDSRRIQGEYTITLTDVLRNRHYPDTIAIGVSDFDPHSISQSIFGKLGYRPIRAEKQKVEIPYRACLPRKMENLILCCKAISADWEASNFLRMSRDKQNLGYGIGLISAMCCKQGIRPKNFDVTAIQQNFLEQATIPKEVLERDEKEILSDEEYVQLLFDGNENILFDVYLYCSERIKPLLEAAFSSKTDNNQLVIAKALAWFGSRSGMDVLINELIRLNDTYPFFSYYDRHPYHNGEFRTGIFDAIDDYWQMNQMIVLLGLLQDKTALPVLCDLLDKTIAGGPPLNQSNNSIAGKIHMQRIPNYDRVEALCFAFDHIPDKAAIPFLEKLLDRDYLSGYMSRSNETAGKNYYSSLLELKIAAALAACGGKRGLAILAEYTKDVHYEFEDFARRKIAEFTSDQSVQDFPGATWSG